MRILFLTHRLPYAPNRGDRIRAFHILKALAPHMDVDVISLVHDDEEESQTPALREMTASVTTARVPRLRNLRRAAAALPTSRPLTHVLLETPDLRPKVSRVVESHRPDLVFAYCSGLAPLAMEPPLKAHPCVLDMVDVDSAKWAALAGTVRPPLRWIYAREARCLARFEAGAARHAVDTLLVNERERSILVQLAPDASIHVVENGVDVGAFRPPEAPAEHPHVIFCGVMNYPPNEEAALWLHRTVWPLVRAVRPDARLWLVGSSPTARVMNLARQDPSVEVTGTVADVRPYVWNSAVSVAPISTARGIQNKVLEAIAGGLPCVVTPAVAEGLPHEARIACTVSEHPDTFAAGILKLLSMTGAERRAIASRVDLEPLEWRARLGSLPDRLKAAASSRRSVLSAEK